MVITKIRSASIFGIFILSVLISFSFLSVPVSSGKVEVFPSGGVSQSFSRIVLFSWDGVQYNHFMDLYDAGNLSNIKKLVNESSLLLRTYITDHDTSTNPGHVCILTGSGGPSVCPDGDITIWEEIEDWNSSWVTGSIAGKSKFSGTIFPSYVYNDVDYWYAKDVYSDVCTDLAIEFIQNYSDSGFFLFVHFRDPDSAGHGYGENSQQYTDAIIACDTQLGRVMSALETEGILNSTAVVVTVDHGFMEGGTSHGGNPWPSGDINTYKIFTACNRGTVETTSLIWDQNDVAPTVYSLAGISDYSSRFPFLKGYALWDRTASPAKLYTKRITIENFTFEFSILSNASISNIAFNQTAKKISFRCVGAAICNVTIPEELLDGGFLILIDGTRTGYILTLNATHSFIYFTCGAGTHTVEIIGTTVIPEFSLPFAFALIAVVVLLASFKLRKKLYL